MHWERELGSLIPKAQSCLGCITSTQWCLRDEGAKQCTYDLLMLSKVLFCRYAQAYDAQHVD